MASVSPAGGEPGSTSERSLLITGAVVLVLLVSLVSFCRARSETSHRELVSFGDSIQLGDSADEVMTECLKRSDDFRCFRGERSVSVVTPPELGAKNWVLLVELEGGLVTAVRYRTSDSVNEQPDESPVDRGGVDPRSGARFRVEDPTQ